MPLVGCRECGSEVSEDAKTCPHCGAVKPAQSEKPKTPKDWLEGCAVVAALGIAGLVALGYVIDAFGGGEQPGELDRTEAIVACEASVEEELVAPASADFANSSFSIVEPNRAEVTGEVDAENSFGATIRNDFRCVFERRPDGEWTVSVEYVR